MKSKLTSALLSLLLLAPLGCGAQEGTRAGQTTTAVVYFSATGTTASAAQRLADLTGGDLIAITPESAYSADDLDWHNKQSRSSLEMKDPQSRPPIKDAAVDLGKYQVVLLGYPIWWNQAPRVINTFIESHELAGKVVKPFATSGSSPIGNSARELKKSYPKLGWRDGLLMNKADDDKVRQWLEE